MHFLNFVLCCVMWCYLQKLATNIIYMESIATATDMCNIYIQQMNIFLFLSIFLAFAISMFVCLFICVHGDGKQRTTAGTHTHNKKTISKIYTFAFRSLCYFFCNFDSISWHHQKKSEQRQQQQRSFDYDY